MVAISAATERRVTVEPAKRATPRLDTAPGGDNLAGAFFFLDLQVQFYEQGRTA